MNRVVGTCLIAATAAGMFLAPTPSQANKKAWGVVEKIQLYTSGRIRFRLKGVSDFCTDKDGDKQGWLEIRKSQGSDAALGRIAKAVMASHLSGHTLVVAANDSINADPSKNYKIGCKIYKVEIKK